jgi:hypothetical protein
MRQNMADINSTEGIVDLHDQPVLIAFNVEDRALTHSIRRRKSLSDVSQIPP